MVPFKIKWKNMVEPERPQMAVSRMRFVCWMSKARNMRLKKKILSCMYSFGYFPGVRLWFADVSETSISSIFKGWM